MFQLIQAGGVLMWPILFCSVLGLAIALERFGVLRRRRVVPPFLLDEVRDLLGGAVSPAQIYALRQHSPLGEVFAAGLHNPSYDRAVLKETLEEAGRHVVQRLSRNLNALNTIAAVTPLMGLLGTVIGMIKVFAAIHTFGSGEVEVLSSGIAEALLTTAAGLGVGIPCLVLHQFLRSRVNALAMDLEQQSLLLLDLLDQTRNPVA